MTVVIISFVLVCVKAVILRRPRNTEVIIMEKAINRMKLITKGILETCWSIGTSTVTAVLSA